jgi:hypothetical protein
MHRKSSNQLNLTFITVTNAEVYNRDNHGSNLGCNARARLVLFAFPKFR